MSDRYELHPQLRAIISNEFTISLSISILICLFRISLFDYLIFAYRALPSHDSLTAAGMFGTNVQSIRLFGDLAWWLPSPTGGYPQYFNFFLSPLAPTGGNIPFMLWTDVVSLFSHLGLVVPEYSQFLIFELLLMPVLAYTALILLTRRFCAGWFGPSLCAIGYALSGTGLWNNAWMFYQEWANIFFLFYASDKLVTAPTRRSTAVFGLAIANLVSSANYWTIFSSWFLATFVLAYSYCRWARIKQLLRRAWLCRTTVSLGSGVVVGLFFAVTVGWVVMITSIYKDESRSFIRYDNRPAGYTMEQVYGRSQTGGIGRFTAELFQPVPAPPPKGYLAGNWMHTANYIGAGLLPLIVAFAAASWTGLDLVLFSLLVMSASITSGSAVFIALWRLTPGMYAILHAFYFYSYFVETTLLIIAARGLDLVTRQQIEKSGLSGILGCIVVGCASLLAVLAGANFDAVDTAAFNSFSLVGLAVISSGLIAYQTAVSTNPKKSKLLPIILLLLVAGDLGRYYYVVADKDKYFTLNLRKIELRSGFLPNETVQAMKRVWDAPGSTAGFNTDLFANLPVTTSLWPDNDFNPPQTVRNYRAMNAEMRKQFTPAGAVAIVPSGIQDRDSDRIAVPSSDPLDVHFLRTDYNGFVIDLNLAESSDLLLKLAFDENWSADANGKQVPLQRVNGWMTAMSLPAGHSILTFTFAPFSRLIYRPLRALTYLYLISSFLFCFARRSAHENDNWRRSVESCRQRCRA